MEAFENMVGDCPAAFLSLAVTCCNVSAHTRWSRPGSSSVTDVHTLIVFVGITVLPLFSDECGEASLVL